MSIDLERTILRPLAPALIAMFLLAGCGSGSDQTSRDEPSASPTVPAGGESEYIAALYERDSLFEMAEPAELIGRGETICNNMRDEWQELGADAAGLIFQAATQGVDSPTFAVAQDAWSHLCPELNPDYVPEGEIPQGVTIDPGARKPDSQIGDGDRFDFNVIISLTGAGGGGDQQGGFARTCDGSGAFSDLRAGTSVQFALADGSLPSTTGEVGSGIVQGADCQFFITALDVPAVAEGDYVLTIGSIDPIVVSASDAQGAEFEPLMLTLGE